MANIVSDTIWHGNPRPIQSYCTTVFDSAVVSPYYAKTMAPATVPTHATYNTSLPLASLTPTLTIDTTGPATAVQVTTGGLWVNLQGLSINITRTDGDDGDYITSLFHGGTTVGPVEIASEIAEAINEEVDMIATSEGQVITITAVSPVTSLTIVTFAVI